MKREARPRRWWSPNDIRCLRLTLGWTQRELVDALRAVGKEVDRVEPQTDYGTVSRWERGKACPGPYYRRLLSVIEHRHAAGEATALDP